MSLDTLDAGLLEHVLRFQTERTLTALACAWDGAAAALRGSWCAVLVVLTLKATCWWAARRYRVRGPRNGAHTRD